MARTLLTLTAAAALIYLTLCTALFSFQRSLIYFPQPRALSPGTSMFTLPVDGANLVVTTRPLQGLTQDRQAKGALIYFGGNAEDVSYSLPGLAAAFPGHAVYLMHYRGYGGSTGAPSEAALIADALALFDKVYSEHKNIVVVGRSLGSGVAVQLASRRPVARLVLVTPYDSIAEIAVEVVDGNALRVHVNAAAVGPKAAELQAQLAQALGRLPIKAVVSTSGPQDA